MSFPEAVSTVLTKKYADFSGRAGRPEFWWFYLFTVLVSIVVNIIDRSIDNYVLGYVVSALLLIPGLAVAVRRLHDTARSGWWLLLYLIPIIGWIVLLVFFLQPSRDVVVVTA